MGFLHVYGSARRGPYAFSHTGGRAIQQDNFTDTFPRIEKAIELYKHVAPSPTRVVVAVQMWDLVQVTCRWRGCKLDVPPSRHHEWVRDYTQRITALVHHVERVVPGAIIGLLTFPRTAWGQPLQEMANAGLRDVARTQGSRATPVVLFDWAALAESFRGTCGEQCGDDGFWYSERGGFMRDLTHPSDQADSAFVHMLLAC